MGTAKHTSLTIAAAQIAPVWLDRERTLAKVARWIGRAADRGAGLVAFGEALVPGYPWWLEHTNAARFNSPMQKTLHAHYLAEAVDIDASHLDAVCAVAKKRKIAVVLGTIERPRDRGGHSVYCSLVYIDPKGSIASVHRKLMPTYEERLSWAPGDGHGLVTHALGAFTVDGGQSARLGRPEGAAERAKQVSDALAVLADRQVRQLDAGRMITGAGLGGVEGLMDIFGGCRGVGQRQRARIVLRHLPGDILGQGSDRLLADEGFVRLAGDAFAHRAVAAHAILTVDGFAGPGRRQVLLVVALALTTGEGEDGHADDGEPDLDGPGKGHGVMTD